MVSALRTLRAGFRLARCGVHLVAAAATVALIYPVAGPKLRLNLKQRWSRQLLGILGIELEVSTHSGPLGTMIVANHVSWLDIYAINAVAPAAFVCKADVRRWPLIGWLCANTDTIFIERGKSSAAQHALLRMRSHLDSGLRVAVFPEGTSSDGRLVLPFHGAMLQAALDSGVAVQPVALRYTTRDGSHSAVPAYWGDITLWESLRAVAHADDLVAEVDFLTPIEPASGSERRGLTRRLHQLISGRLAQRRSDSTARRLEDEPPLASQPNTAQAQLQTWISRHSCATLERHGIPMRRI